MTRWVRRLLTLLGALVLLAACYVLFFGTVEWRSAAIRNQSKVIGLLAHAQYEAAGDGRSQRIVLGDKVVLSPDHGKTTSGYVFTAHVRSSGFTVEAHPAEPGKTGLFSYFLDDAGVVRFEMGQREASATSRPLDPASAERRP
jgi:hypothetical protein